MNNNKKQCKTTENTPLWHAEKNATHIHQYNQKY